MEENLSLMKLQFKRFEFGFVPPRYLEQGTLVATILGIA